MHLYFESNNTFQETILLLHGWAGSKAIWKYHTPRLASKWKVVEVDLWGHGDSLPPSSYLTPPIISDDILNVLDKVGSPDCYIIAHSMGCAIALSLALHSPKRVKGLILIEGIYPIPEMFASKGRPIDDNNRRQIFEQMLYPHANETWAVNLINEMMIVPTDVLEKYNEFLRIDRVAMLKKTSCPYQIISRENYRGKHLQAQLWGNLGLDESSVLSVQGTSTHFVLQENPLATNQTLQQAVYTLKKKADMLLKISVESFFSAQAEQYFSSPMHATERLDELVDLLELTGKEKVIDLGCGAGHTTFAVAPYAKEVLAYDFSKKMLQIVEREILNRKLSNVTTILGDVQSLTYPNSTFDRLTSRIAAHHFPDLEKFIMESARVLKNNGIMVIVDNTAPNSSDLYLFTDGIEKLKDSSHFHLYPETTWRILLSAAGFKLGYFRYYKARHIFSEWAAVANIETDTLREIERQLLNANEKIKSYFQIEIEEGKVKSFCIDRLTLQARIQK